MSIMEKERLHKRNADVVEEASEATAKRPQLDGEEEMDNKQDEQDKQDVTRTLEAAAVNMDFKIRNIRMMARQVRGIATIMLASLNLQCIL